MAFTSLPNVGEQVTRTYKMAATITDNDLGKPVKISAADTVALCATDDPIYGFINSVEVATEGGLRMVGIVVSGRVRITLNGAVAIGAKVQAGVNTAAGIATVSNWGTVKTRTAVAGDKNWILISGTGADGTDGTIESL
jgi:hypothetical protein